MRNILIIFSLFLTACAHPTATQTPWNNFSDAWHLSNGKLNVIVVPSIGRIMHFGPSANRNFLWAQPDAARYNKQYVDFDNFGGEKLWLWPQQTWPPTADGLRYHATYHHNTLTLTSDVISPHSVRIVRKITLHPSKPIMTITSQLKPVSPNIKPPHVALWSVAQIHLPHHIDVTLDHDTKPPFVSPFDTLPAWPIASIDNHTATFIRDPNLEAKSGLDASTITVIHSDITLNTTASSSSPGPYDPHTRAQLYVQSNVFNTHPKHLPPYAEIEFISPWPTETHPFPTLTIRWTLTKQETR